MYKEQLATVHDRWFREHALGAAKFLLKQIPDPSGPIVDLGCGSGVLLEQFRDLIEEGYGSDISSEMIKLASGRVPSYRFVECDLFEAEFPQAQIIVSVGEIISYASVNRPNPEVTVGKFFTKVASKLKSAGVLLFDVVIDDFDFNYDKELNFNNHTIRIKSRSNGKVITSDITTIPNAQISNESQETHHLYIFKADWLVETLRKSGFEVETLREYDDYKLPPGRLAFFCRPN